MKAKIVLACFIMIGLAVVGFAVTTNPASNVTADSANTALTIPYRDANGSFAMGQLIPLVQTKAQIDVLTPAAVGAVIVCTNCTIPYSLCTATGAAVSMWARAGSATVGCGTGN